MEDLFDAFLSVRNPIGRLKTKENDSINENLCSKNYVLFSEEIY